MSYFFAKTRLRIPAIAVHGRLKEESEEGRKEAPARLLRALLFALEISISQSHILK